MRGRSFVSFVLLLGTALAAQGPKLAERVAQERANVAVTINVDGPPLAFDRVLEKTDLVIRGVIGQAVPSLSDDGRDIYTTYQLVNSQVLFSANVQQLARPGMPAPATLTQKGGSVIIDGFTASVGYDIVPELSLGMDVVALLHEDKGKYWPAADYGLFEVRNSLITPLVRRSGDHQRFAGMNADSFIAEVLALRKSLPTK